MQRLTAAQYRALAAKPKRSKYSNVPTEYTSHICGRRTYHSKFEARHAAYLDTLAKAGTIRTWVPQVSIPVPRTTKRMVVDFMVIDPDGAARFQDTKGAPPTRDWLLKRDLVHSGYGITVEIVSALKRPR